MVEFLKRPASTWSAQERELFCAVHDLVRQYGLRLVVEATAGLAEELAQAEETAAREDAERDMDVGQAAELESYVRRML